MKYTYDDQLLGSLIVIYKPDEADSNTSSSTSSTSTGINAYETSKWLHPNFCRHRSKITTKRMIRVGDRVQIIQGSDTGCYGTVTLAVPSSKRQVFQIRLEGTKGTVQRYYDIEKITKVDCSSTVASSMSTTQNRIQLLLEELSDANPPPVRHVEFDSSGTAKGGCGSQATKKTAGTTKCDSSPSDEEDSVRDRYRTVLPEKVESPKSPIPMEPFIIDLVDSSEHLLSPAHSVASAPRHSIFRGLPSRRPNRRTTPVIRRRRALQVGDTVDIVKGIYKEKAGKVVKISGESVAHVQVKGIGVAQLLSQDILSLRPDPPIGLNVLFACGGPP